jgi:long-chain acyl-CoA synthetase
VVDERALAASREGVPHLPAPVRAAVKDLLSRGQHGFYELLGPEVTGRAFIPHNRNTIVIANHASHLDMGLVKYALGTYGEGIVAFAAADYFFDDRWKRAYFENFTNLAPLDRRSGLAKTIRAAGEILASGKTVLVFPEGTRSTDGEMKPFKRLFAQLALAHGIDLLPLYLRGTFEALPKGAMMLKPGPIAAHIGPPLCVGDLTRLVGDVAASEQARRVAEMAQYAVEALRDGDVLDLTRLEPDDLAQLGRRRQPLASVFSELEHRFQKGVVDRPLSFYFALGDEPGHKWTCTVDAERCVISMGKPKGGLADCVLKTSPAMFTRIVREAYTPGVDEFVAGTVKSNDLGLLGTFQKVFGLGSGADPS